jgi:hypothetical protein
MNEKEWLISTEPLPMLDHLRGTVSDRKLRLYGVGCCRRIWNLLTDERSRNAVEVAEEYADALVSRQRLVAARDGAREAKLILRSPSQTSNERAANAAFNAARDTGWSAACNSFSEAARALNVEDHNHFEEGELCRQASLVRCIFGNAFRPLSLDRHRLTPNVVALAQTIYDNRAFDCMLKLFDALQDACCADQDILAHCLEKTEHFRGCWVVDAILGKS